MIRNLPARRMLPAPVVLLLYVAAIAAGGKPRDASAPAAAVPLVHAHAHNDYEHTRPLLDALDCGFCSVEADIYLIDGKLLVAHNRSDVRPDRTLQALYLDALRDRTKENGGRVYKDGPPFTLLVDFKDEAKQTWAVLGEVLKAYAPMLTTWRDGKRQPGAVTVILTGNGRGLSAMEAAAPSPVRYVAFDGQLPDLDASPPPPAELVPWISSDWKRTFKWNGKGQIPDDERRTLRALVEKAHAQGRVIRFWGSPDVPAAWSELRAAGVDLINSDDLKGLREFLLKE